MSLAVGTVIAGRYRVDGVLGHGGMGVVFMATHLLLNQRVAIKLLRREIMVDADAVSRFVREAQAAAKIQSEHIVRVHDVGMVEDGTPYIVMEYVEGMVLANLLASQGALPVRDAIRFALQTAEGLAETHAAGIIHGDLKPENIYVAGTSETGRRVKLLDFGISKLLLEDRNGPREHPSFVMGTPAYMAPELFESGSVEPRTDLWALGAVLYEMLAGRPPFRGDTPESTRDLVRSATPAPIERADVPPGVVEIVERCLRKKPEQRYRTAVEVVTALESFAPVESSAQRLEQMSVRMRTSSPATSQRLVPTMLLPNRRGSRARWALAGVGILGVLGLLLIGLTVRARGQMESSSTTTPTLATETATSTSLEPASSTQARPATLDAQGESPPGVPATSLPAARAVRPPATPKTRRVPTPPAPTASVEGDRYGTRK